MIERLQLVWREVSNKNIHEGVTVRVGIGPEICKEVDERSRHVAVIQLGVARVDQR